MTIFKALQERVFNYTQDTTSKEPDLVTKTDGFSFTNFFKGLASKNKGDPFSKFNSKNITGRVTFDQFEKQMHPPAPNQYNKADTLGLQDIISLVDSVVDELEGDELDIYNAMRRQVWELVQEAAVYYSSTGPLGIVRDFLEDNYSEYNVREIISTCDNFLDVIDDVSLRDQLISFKELNSTMSYNIRNFRFNIPSGQDTLIFIAAESVVNDLNIRIDTILNKYTVETETTVEPITNFLGDYTPAEKIDRSRAVTVSTIANYPFARYIKSDFLNAHRNSVASQAKSIDQPQTNDPMAAMDKVIATASPNAEAAPGTVGTGDKIQEENDSIDTTEYKGVIGPMSEDQYLIWRDWLAQEESTNNYGAVNTIGYCGRYQFGAPALIDLGYVHSGVSTRSLINNSSWTGKDGITSRAAFLADTELQDKLILRFSRINYKRCKNAKTIKPTDSPAKVGGLLAVSHLLGSGGAKNFTNGSDGNDAYGTKASDYYDGAIAAIGGNVEPASADEARTYQENAAANTVPDSMPMSIPTSAAAPVYPYNSVRTFEGGHVEEYDSTPGSERISVRHKTGSGSEIHPDGSKTDVTNGARYIMITGDDTIIINGSANIYVEGDCGLSGGNVNINAREDLNINAGGKINMSGADINVNASGQYAETIMGNKASSVAGYSMNSVDGDYAQYGGSMTLMSKKGNMNLMSEQDMFMLSNSNFTGTFNGNYTVNAEGDGIVSSTGSMTTHGSGGNLVSSNGQTSIAGSGTIGLSHPVEAAEYATTAGEAPLGTAVPVTPSASSSSNNSSESTALAPLSITGFSPFEFGATQESAGGQGTDPASTKSPLSVNPSAISPLASGSTGNSTSLSVNPSGLNPLSAGNI